MTTSSWVYYDDEPRPDWVLFFYAVRLAGRDLFEQMFVLPLTNLIATVLFILLPLFPPAMAGLWSAAAETAREEEPTFRHIIAAAKAYALRAWGLMLLSTPVYIIVLMNVLFYARDNVPLPFEAGPGFVVFLRYIWVFVGLLWTVFWTYAAAWMIFEESPLGAALKKALQLMVLHPFFTFLLLIVLALLLALNLFILAFFFFLTWAFLATLSVRSVQLLTHGLPHPVPPEAFDGGAR
ncbi:MAG: hypothetical protein ACLFU8_02965 [Anaerolineales bacterium]